MTMQETIARVLQDNAFKQEFSDSFGIDNTFKCDNCALDEDVFIAFLKKCKSDCAVNRIFENIYYLIINKENVTDNVFKMLVDMAGKKQNHWLWVGLTHANLSECQQNYLKSLPFLNESVFY